MAENAETKKPTAPTTLRVELDGRYAGWWADCDDDPDGAFLDDLSGVLARGQFGPVWDALLRVVVNWNFTDKQGAPAPVDADGMRRVSARALLNLATGYMRSWSELPNQRGDG